jgi:hypothetical protein
MLTYALVLLYCTSRLECWREEPFPQDRFASAEDCRAAVEARARGLLQPHFEQDHSNIRLFCEPQGQVAKDDAATSGSSTPSGADVPPGADTEN